MFGRDNPTKENRITIILSEDDFRRLVAGKEITPFHVVGTAPRSVRMILADIGFDRMALHLNNAMESGDDIPGGEESK